MQKRLVWEELISAIIPVAGFPNGTSQIDSWTESEGLRGFEIIFVDDSDDKEVQKKLKEIAAKLSKYSKVKIMKSQSRNPGGARNLGLSIAEGSWIVFWDCDDIPNPSKVKEMIIIANDNNSDVALGNFQIRDGSSRNVKIKKVVDGQHILESVAINPGLWRFAFKSKIAKSIAFPELSMGEDQIYLANYLTYFRTLSFYPEIVYEYWNHPSGQLTKNRKKMRELNSAVNYFYTAYESSKCLPLFIVITRLTITSLKHNSILEKIKVLFRLTKLILFQPTELKNLAHAISFIWRFR